METIIDANVTCVGRSPVGMDGDEHSEVPTKHTSSSTNEERYCGIRVLIDLSSEVNNNGE